MKVVYDDLIWWASAKSPGTAWQSASDYAKRLVEKDKIPKEKIEIWWENLPLTITVNKKTFD